VWCRDNIEHRWALATLLALDTGARRGEILGLQWTDYSAREGTIKIARQVAQVPVSPGVKTPHQRVPKTAASRRTIKLAPRTVAAIEAFRALRRPASIGGHIFHLRGGLEHPNSLTVWIERRLAVITGVPGLHIHQLRHTHASHLLSAGVPIAEVSRRLGHSSVSTTMKVYAHSLLTDDSRAAEAWARVTAD
jgi:integrase